MAHLLMLDDLLVGMDKLWVLFPGTVASWQLQFPYKMPDCSLQASVSYLENFTFPPKHWSIEEGFMTWGESQ